MRNMPFKENEFSWFSKGAVYVVLILACISTVINIYQGLVVEPESFVLVLFGFLLFSGAKLSVIISGRLVSFGTKSMSNIEANVYRLGYWFMVVGIIFTFAGQV